MKYLEKFVIASSYIVFLPFFYVFYNLKKESYFNYTLLAPLWFGVWNVISFIISKHYGLSLRSRFILVSFISYSVIISYASYKDFYNFTKKQWCKYYILMLITYLVTWNVVIYNIENLIS